MEDEAKRLPYGHLYWDLDEEEGNQDEPPAHAEEARSDAPEETNQYEPTPGLGEKRPHPLGDLFTPEGLRRAFLLQAVLSRPRPLRRRPRQSRPSGRGPSPPSSSPIPPAGV